MPQQVYWGDMHLNLHHPDVSRIDAVFTAARDQLDFFPIAYYPYDYQQLPQGLKSESIGLSDQSLRDWEMVRAAVRKHNDPGRFITFAGYEWHGDRRSGGDHNVFYPEDGALALPDTLPELYEHCRASGAIAIPHHTAYRAGPGSRGRDWSLHDEGLSPVAEIYSHHGCSEGVDAPLGMTRNRSMGPRVSGGSIQEGLARGLRMGIIASGDTHTGYPGVWSNGLVAVWAEELTRKALWEALLQRRTYGVTGDRMVVDFRVADAPMGSVIKGRGELRILASVTGDSAIDRIELLRNGQVIATHCHAGTWEVEPPGPHVHAKLRITVGWGPGHEYGFSPSERRWDGCLSIEGGEIVRARGCFTRPGQHLRQASERQWDWELTTSDRRHPEENVQGVVFELIGTPDAQLSLEVDGQRAQLSLGDALRGSQVIPLLDEARSALRDQFGLTPEDVPSPDVLYHNAPKVKIHRGVPQDGYTARATFSDDAPAGSYYYLRVSQTNGQMAWTSPIWVER
jgi:hypothetical protein